MNDSSAQILLRASALTCERDGRRLFQKLDLTIAAGDVMELRGPNGSGKTTLLRCLAGLTADYEGSVERRLPTAYCGHRGGLKGELTPLENLRWYAALAGDRADARSLRETLDAMGLEGYALTPCQQLSAGQQRRAALARLRLTRARLWLLDEPLTSLDEDGCALVRELLEAHRRNGGGAICATHTALEVAGTRMQTLGVAA
jgi:heme exporter protein A